MILQEYSVYDTAAAAYIPPFYAQNHAVAIRMVQKAAMDPTHTFSKFAGQFVLYHTGSWDDATALHTQKINEELGTLLALLAQFDAEGN